MRTKEEHEFETKQLADSICREIDQTIAGLQTMKQSIEVGRFLYEHYMPQQPLIDLAIRYGELVAMKRIEVA